MPDLSGGRIAVGALQQSTLRAPTSQVSGWPVDTVTDPNENQEYIDPLTVGELITLAEAAEYAGLTKRALNDYIKRGRLKAKRVGLFWLTTQAAVDAYLASRSSENIPKKYRDRS